MKEYWINVYRYRNGETWLGAHIRNKKQAYLVSKNVYISSGIKTIYRIHVRLK